MDISTFCKSNRKQFPPTTADDIRDALQFIDPNMPRDEWARIGMAIKSAQGEYGIELFDGWSQTADNYKQQDTLSTWRSVNSAGGIGVGTLFKLAIEGGYKPESRELIPADFETMRRQAAQRKAAAEKQQAETEEKRAEVAVKAQRIFSEGTPAAGHEYLVDKRITAKPLRRYKAALIAPLFYQGKLVNIQFIYPDGTKRPLTGGRVSGCHHPIGRISGHLYICEGVATGYSLFEHTGVATAVALNCTNLKHVAVLIRQKYPDLKITLAADNDTKTPGNPGLTKAREAAAVVGGSIIYPTFDEGQDGTDFNDYFNNGGTL